VWTLRADAVTVRHRALVSEDEQGLQHTVRAGDRCGDAETAGTSRADLGIVGARVGLGAEQAVAGGSGEVSTDLGWCKVGPDEMQYVRELQEIEERDPGLWSRPRSMRSLAYHESTALRSTSYSTEVVPGLLQTEAYMTELFRANALAELELRACVQVRLNRQAILYRDNPAEFICFIHEQAVRLPVGGADLMREQLLHLVFVAAKSNVSVRVVPTSAGGHTACRGTFNLLENGKGHRPLVFLDSWAGGVFIDEKASVAEYQRLLPKLDSISLSEAESQLWLADLASDHGRAKGEPDAELEDQ
jgi:hypothetical protein